MSVLQGARVMSQSQSLFQVCLQHVRAVQKVRSSFTGAVTITVLTEFFSMLLPSWRHSVKTGERTSNVDILVFCEDFACQLLPPDCRPMMAGGTFTRDALALHLCS